MGRNTWQPSREGLSISITKHYKETGKGQFNPVMFFFPLERRRRSRNRKKLRRRQRFQLVDQRTTRDPKVEERLPSSHWREDTRYEEVICSGWWKLKVYHQLQSHRLDVVFWIWHDLILQSLFHLFRTSWRKSKRSTKTRTRRTESWWCSCWRWGWKKASLRFCGEVTDGLLSFFSLLVPPRMRRRRGRRERKGRGKKNPPENPPLWNQARNLIRWRPQRRTQRRRGEGKRWNRKERKEALQNKRRR